MRPVFQVKHKQVAIGAAATRILTSNPDRIAVVFGAITANAVIQCEGQPTSATDGLTLATGNNPLTFNRDAHYEMPSREWWGWQAAAGAVVDVTEVILVSGGWGG